MDVVSLFSGCGGTDLGFKNAGCNIIIASDSSESACEIYKNNFGFSPINCNIKKIKKFPNADILIGCYPCQGFSFYGNRNMDDPRNYLYLEFLRALKQVKPKYFVTENVKGLVFGYGKEIMNRMLKSYRRNGYRVYWKLIDAKWYGVPQDRERIFMVGIKSDLNKKYSFPEPTHGEGLKPYTTLKEAIGDLPEPKENEYWSGGYSSHYMSRNRKREWNQTSFTIQTQGRHVPLHPSSPTPVKVHRDKYIFTDNGRETRRLSIRECARIQSFPDSFKFTSSITSNYKVIGNAVPPLLSEKFAESIICI